MNVLHIAYSLNANSAATRISSAIEGTCHNFFYLGRVSEDTNIRSRQVNASFSNFLGLFFHVLDLLFSKIFRKEQNEIFSFGVFYRLQGLWVKYLVKKNNIDVIHIHWGGYSFFPVESLKYIDTKIIITAHDYNYFTGGCHVPMSCEKYTDDCCSCPFVNKNSFGEKLVNFIKKRRAKTLFHKKNTITVVAPSNYTKNVINLIYPFLHVEVIGNPLGKVYAAESLPDCLNRYNTQLNERKSKVQILVVSVFNSERDNKGFKTLVHFLKELKFSNSNIEIVAVSGAIFHSDIIDIKLKEHCSEEELVEKYISADMCLVPSKFETFSQVTLESISLGTPIISFNLSGPKDIIVNYKTGFLVNSFNDKIFCETVLKNLYYKRNNLNEILHEAEKTRSDFGLQNVGNKYFAIYNMEGLL